MTLPIRTASFALAMSATLHAQDPFLLAPTIVEAERIDDEPSAVSVISRQSLDLFQVRSFSDLSGIVPGFNVVSADSRGFGQVVAMRGSTNTLFFGPPALGLTIDDVPLGDAFSYPSELLHLSEARVYRGPQGPNFGRNGPAGMVEMFTPRPGEKVSTSLTAEYGSYDHIGLGLNTSGPLGGNLSYTLQLFHDQRDGFIRNTFLNDETDDRETTGGLLKLYWNPSDDFELSLRFFAEHVNDGSQRLTSLSSPDKFTVFSDNPGVTDLERYQISLHSRKDFTWGKLETISSFQTWSLAPSTVDLDLQTRAMPSPPFGGFPVDSRSRIFQDQDLVSNEIRFSSNEDASFRWRAGLFQLWTDNSGNTLRQTQAPFGPGGSFVSVLDETTTFDVEQLNLAAFANSTFALSERLDFDAGLRFDYYRSEINRTKVSIAAPNNIVRGSQDEVFVSPTLGLTYQATESVNLFARSSLGIKPGGYSAFVDADKNPTYDREENWSNEIGADFFSEDHNVRVGLRAYWDQIDDYQVNQGALGTTDFFILNAEEVTSRGIEADLAWAPIDRLTIRGAFGYTNAEFNSFRDPNRPGTTYNGNEVPFVPEYSGSLGVRYEFESGFYVSAAGRVVGPTRFDSANSSTFTQDAYITADAEIGYMAENFSVSLYGTNLFDKGYYTFINPQIAAGSPGDPQQFGIRVITTF
ncbi:MAG: TonB-dependent receptor [Akkermansiaceae bacterium]|nr:TonB-dependent receptor [Akkermansiaceae bacterium]